MRTFLRLFSSVSSIGLAMAIGPVRAADITATGSQPTGANWNQATWTGGQWSDGLAPSAGKTYSTAGYQIRTPTNNSAFGGASLRIATNGSVLLKQNEDLTSTATLILDGGQLISGTGWGSGGLQVCAGNIHVNSASFVNLGGTDRRRIAVRNGALSGSADMTITGGTDINDIFQLEATLTSSHTGNWTINGGRLVVNRDDQIGDQAHVTMAGTLTNAYLDVRGDQRVGSLSGTGTVRCGTAGSRTLSVGGNGTDATFLGLIENGSGTLALSKEGAGLLRLTAANTYSGGTTLGAGELQVDSNSSLGTGTLTIDGGTITPRSGNRTLTNAVVVRGDFGMGTAGGDDVLTLSGPVDLNGGVRAIAVPAVSGSGYLALSGVVSNGGLTKAGANRLTLAGTNTYAGPTTVNEGWLDIAGPYLGGGALTVTGGLLGIRADAAVGPITIRDGGALAVTVPSAGVSLTTPAMTNGSATSVTNVFHLGSGNPTAPVLYATNLTIAGTAYVKVTGQGLSVGPFALVAYAGADGLTDSSFALSELPAGVLGYLSNNTANLSVDLVVTQAPYLVWQGAANGADTSAWDINFTSNWIDSISLAPAAYVDGQSVRFDDSAPGTNLVVPSSAVSPSGVIVSNAAKDYLFAGSFPIAGAGRFAKEGTGTVTMALANTYSGDTVIEEGVFRLSTANVIPDGFAKGNVVVDGTLDLNGKSEGINGLSGGGTITNGSLAGLTLTVGNNNGGGTFSGDLIDTGIGGLSLIKSGGGRQTLAGDNTFAGALTVSGGTLELGGPGTVAGAVSLGGTLRLLDDVTNRGVFSLTADSTLDVDPGATARFSGFTGGAFNLAKTGGGTLLLTNGAATLASFHTRAGTTIVDNITISNSAFDSVGLLAGDNGVLIAQGSARISDATDFNVGDVDTAVGRVEVRDSAALWLRNLWLGKNGTCQGFVYQTGGSVTNAFAASADWRIAGNGATAAGTVGGYYLSGGSLDVSANFQIGAYGYGEMIVSGGVVRSWVNWPVVGRYAGSTGRLEVGGGTFRQLGVSNNLIVGEAGAGWLVVSNGGLVVCTNSLSVGSVNAGTGTATVILGAGGIIVAPRVAEHAAGANSTLDFDGGTLQATTSNCVTFLEGLDAANVRDGGAVIDTAGWEVTIGQSLLAAGTGGLTKIGAGALTLAGANTYTGTTRVDGGRLNVTPAVLTGGGSLAVGDGAVLSVSLTAAATPLTASSLTLGATGLSLLELDAGTRGSATSAVVNTGTLIANGTAVLQVFGPTAPGVTRLIDYSGAIGGGGFGSLVLAPLPMGVEGELVDNGVETSVDLNITNIFPVRWAGYGGSTWDINATGNWETSPVPSAGFAYTDGSHVRFDDDAYSIFAWGTGPTVTLASNVHPSSLVVSNETGEYVFAGGGRIIGAQQLVKQGAARLTVSNANDYTGDTRIEGGILRVGNAASLGASPGGEWIIDGGSLDLNGVDLNGRLNAVRIKGAGAGGAGAIFNAGPAQQNALRQLALDGDAVVSASNRWDLRSPAYGENVDLNGHTLTKIGTGYLGVAQFTITNRGSIGIQEGMLSVARCLVDGPGLVGIGPAGTLQFENYSTGRFDKAIASTGGTIWARGNDFMLGAPVALAAGSTVGVEAVTLDATNVVSGAGGLTKAGTGTLRLPAANTFQGGVTLAGGTVRIEADSGLGDAAGPLAFSADATLSVTNSFALAPARTVTLDAPASTFRVDPGCVLTIGQAMTGAGGLTKAGMGSLALVGSNAYAGATTIGDGAVLLAGGDDRLPAATVLNFTGNSTLGISNLAQAVGNITVADDMTGTIFGPGGSLAVTSGAAMAVGNQTPGTTLSRTSRLIMSDLSAFVFSGTAASFTVGGRLNSASASSAGIVSLASNALIAADALTVQGTVSGAGGDNTRQNTGTLNLGPAAALHANTINMARTGRDNGHIQYDTAVNNPTLTIRAADGVGRAALALGLRATVFGLSHTIRIDLTNNVSGASTLDALVSSLSVGAYSRGNGQTQTASFLMGGGVLDATSIDLGQLANNNNNSGVLNSTLSVHGGTVKVDTLTVGNHSDANGTLNSTLDLVSGALRARSVTIGAGTANRRFNWYHGAVGNYDASTDLVVTNVSLNLEAGGEHALDVDGGRSAWLYGALTNAGGLAKTGAGTGSLYAVNTYSGPTAVSNGTLLVQGALAGAGSVAVSAGATLGGTGRIAGAVTAAGTVSPGASIGTLTFQSTLTFEPSGTAWLEIDTGASPSNDQAAVAGALTYGGSLVVTNQGPMPVSGDSFALFTAGSFHGGFASLTLPAIPEDTAWDTNTLQTSGVLDVYDFTFGAWTLDAAKNTPTNLPAATLLAQATSSRGTPALASVRAASAMTGGVAIVGSDIVYTPPANYVGPDSFTCVLADGRGSMVVTVSVAVADTVAPAGGGWHTMRQAGGQVVMTSTGTPGVAYVLQTATNLISPPAVTWVPLATNVMPPGGVITNVDAATNRVRFYRTVVP